MQVPVIDRPVVQGVEFYNQDNQKIAYLSTEWASMGIFNDNYYGYVSEEELMYIMEKFYPKMIAAHHSPKKLCNVQALEGAAFDMISDWFEQTLLPQLIEAGMRYNAIVLPEEFFANLTLDLYGDDSQQANESQRLFGNQNDAMAWLNSL
ncbi:MAG: hypothetical protein ACFB0B_18150 [Thermonemataceae bacterium]